MESERCGTQEHVPEKGRVRLDRKSHDLTIECDFASFLQTERLQSSWYERCIS